MDDRDAVKSVMQGLSPEGIELLRAVLDIEKRELAVRSADVTDEIVQKVKGLVS